MKKRVTKTVEKLRKLRSIRIDDPVLSANEQMEKRQEILESLTAVNLSSVKSPSFSVDTVANKNCENLIGKTEVPLGIAGPLQVKGDYAKGDYFIPLATTEGALVASVNRGCKVISDSGGANAFIEQSGITRAPVFRTTGLGQTRVFLKFVEAHYEELEKRVALVNPYIKLLSYKPYILGRNVFLRFVFDTGDAMGMNMATVACESIKNYLEKETKVKCVALSGNVCVDKKPSWLNKIEKRGYSVHAEVSIPSSLVNKILKSDPGKIVEVYNRKILIGGSVAGSIGFNAHIANVIAALFLATGQDIAHVVEGSIGTTAVEIVDKDLYFSVSLPDLPLATVGGGTELATQKEALSIMGVAGGGKPAGANAGKFAEITAAAVLAGEISLISALASDDLARAHRFLAWGEK